MRASCRPRRPRFRGDEGASGWRMGWRRVAAAPRDDLLRAQPPQWTCIGAVSATTHEVGWQPAAAQASSRES